MLRMVTRLLLAFSCLSLSLTAQGQEPPPYSKPPKLEHLFTDDFERDSRANYEISGKKDAVKWEKGTLTIGDGASLQRKLDGGPWVEMELDLEFPKLTEDGQTSDLKVWLDLERATDSFVWFRQKRQNGKTRSAIFFVDSNGRWNKHSKQKPIAQPILLPEKLRSGKWTIGYRFDLWSLNGPQLTQPSFAHVRNNGAEVNSVVVITSGNSASLHGVYIDVLKRDSSLLTPVTLARIKKTDIDNIRVKQLTDAGKYDLALAPAEYAAELREKLLGSFHFKTAESLNMLAVVYLRSGNLNKAEPYFQKANSILEKVVGRLHPLYSQGLNNLGSLNERLGNYSVAERLYLETLDIEKRVLGTRHSGYAVGLNNLGGLYWTIGNFAKAEICLKEATLILEKLFGKENPSYAVALNNLAGFYLSTGDYDQAERGYLGAKAIFEKSLGKEHPKYAISLDNLGDLYRAKDDYLKAETILAESNLLIGKSLGPNHPSYAKSLSSLGSLYQSMGNYSKAKQLLLESMAIRARALGRVSPDYAASLYELGNLYQDMGESVKSEKMYMQSLSIEEGLFGKEHPRIATTLSALASLYCTKGDYAEAEPLYTKSLRIRKKFLGQGHPEYANSLNSMAVVYRTIGEYAKAELLFKQALEISAKNHGKKHPAYATHLNGLGLLYLQMGHPEKSVPLLIEAKSIRERALGPAHPTYATSLNNLITIYELVGDYDQAERYCRQAIDVMKKNGNEESCSYATYIHNLGLIYDAKGDHENAVKSYSEALAIMERLKIHGHPNYAGTHAALAWTLYRKGDFADAERHSRRSLETIRNNFERFSAIQSTNRQKQFASSLDVNFSFYVTNALGLPDPGQSVWKQAVKWKGMSLVRQRQNHLLSELPESKAIFRELGQIKSRLSGFALSNYASEEWNAQVNALTQKEQELEKQMYSLAKNLGVSSDADVSADIQIPDKSCLIDFRKFSLVKVDPQYPGQIAGEPHYLGLVRNDRGKVHMIDLGEASQIEAAINKWRQPIEQANRLGRGLNSSSKSEFEKAGLELKQLVWKPLQKYFADADLLVVSPDSSLGSLPISALPGEKPGTYLLEEKKIVFVPVPGLLPKMLSRSPKVLDESVNALVLGDIDYGADSNESPVDNQLVYRFNRILSGLRFAPLASTKNEIEEIGKRLKNGKIISQVNATESTFRKAAAQCQIIHVATHGFFRSPEMYMKTLPDENQESIALARKQNRVLMENANLLSGLAFANANTARNKTTTSGEDDGILFSAEIAMLPLDRVELAVLSACETSLGTDDNPGEGLIGIQRAFQVAGAKSVVASYWKVDDQATQLLMNKFYENLIKYSKNVKPEDLNNNSTTIRIDALRDAQLWMLNNPVVASKTNRGDPVEVDPSKIKKAEADLKKGDKNQRTHPRYWAAFMLSGDWR